MSMMRAPVEIDRFVPRLRAIEEILYAVAQVYGCAPAEIIGRGKPKTIAEARKCVYLVARRCTRMSYSEIGNAVGGRDHSTVIKTIARAEGQARRDPYFAVVIAELCERFGEEAGITRQ